MFSHTKSLRVLFIVLSIMATSILSACGPRDSGKQPNPSTCTGVGCQQIDNGINQFFQNDKQCSGIIC